jgi:hypothetical protein
MTKASCVLAAGVVFMHTPRAFAQSAPAPTFSAPNTCPSEADFLRRYRSRLRASRSARAIEVRIEASGPQYVGTLSLVDDRGQSTTKTLKDRDCVALVDALALVAALEADAPESDLDSSLLPAPSSPPPPSPAPSPPPASSSSSSEGGPSSTAPSPERAPPVVDVPSRTPEITAIPPSPSASAQATRLGVALEGHGAAGPAPVPLLGTGLFVRWIGAGGAPFGLAVDLGAAASFAPATSVSKGRATFTWLTVSADVYLLRWSLGAGALMRAGIAGDLGSLLARGDETVSPASSSRTWASVGGVADLEVPLTARLALTAVVAVEAPLRRDRYAFGSSDFFDVPFLVAIGGVSLVAYVY